MKLLISEPELINFLQIMLCLYPDSARFTSYYRIPVGCCLVVVYVICLSSPATSVICKHDDGCKYIVICACAIVYFNVEFFVFDNDVQSASYSVVKCARSELNRR